MREEHAIAAVDEQPRERHERERRAIGDHSPGESGRHPEPDLAKRRASEDCREDAVRQDLAIEDAGHSPPEDHHQHDVAGARESQRRQGEQCHRRGTLPDA